MLQEQKIEVPSMEEVLQRCQQAMSEQKTLAELSGMTSDMLEDVYRRGLEHYERAELEDATLCFTYLVMHQPWDRRFHMALGSALHWQEEYQSAVNFYGYALALDARDPGPYFRMAQCLLQLGDTEVATEMLEFAVTHSDRDPAYTEIGTLSRALQGEILAGCA